MIIKIIHKEWKDDVNLNFSKKKMNRISQNNEFATFHIDNNILYVQWDNWGNEIFIKHFDDNQYYLCEEIEFIHDDWIDYCYIDYINNILYRKSNYKKGFFINNNDSIEIKWFDDNNDENNNSNKISDDNLDNKINKIPNIIHFVYGLKEQNDEFELYRYLSILSAYYVNKPDKIYFHYYYEPYGYWWDKIKHLLTLEKIDPPNEIYNNFIYHYAHKADVIRLQKLIEYGGIYLDIDTICLKSFSDLLNNDFVMGIQCDTNNKDYGLCNAVILSKKNSLFGKKWLETYKTFRSTGRDEYWDEHSVIVPLNLSKLYPNNITILESSSFFYPLWYDIKDILFNENINIDHYKNIIKNNYCIHLWDTYSHSYLKTLTENDILTKNTIYNIFSRKFLKNKISLLFLTYNRLDITEKCLNSYLSSLDNDCIEELIILDNNSNNDTINFLRNYQNKHHKIKLIFSDDNLGVCGGRSILFDEAVGDIIISLDSDAYLLDNSFFHKIIDLLYDEQYGIIGIAGAYIKSWTFGTQEDIDESNTNEFFVDHIAGCCQAFRKDLSIFGLKLDINYGKFWVEDTDFCMQSLFLNKKNFRINQSLYIDHHWGGSGSNFIDLFEKNWNYFVSKWKNKVLLHIQ